MKQKTLLLGLYFIMSAVLLTMPVFVVHAQNDVNSGLTKIGSQINPGGSVGIFNPQESPVVIIGKVIRILLFVSGAIAVLFVVIGGFMYLTSAGNEEQATKGRKAITFALVGLVIIILAYIIVSVVVNLVQGQNSLFF